MLGLICCDLFLDDDLYSEDTFERILRLTRINTATSSAIDSDRTHKSAS
jgi:hypothetical protein